MYTKSYIPYKGYYSTPFCKWQGSLAKENAITLGAAVFRQFFEQKDLDANDLDYCIFGNTIGQHRQFYASPWSAALLGAEALPAIAISQACTTGATCINQAAMGIETGLFELPYVLTVDRTSNGPHTIWPNLPKAPADGNAGVIVTTEEKARQLSADEKVTIQVIV